MGEAKRKKQSRACWPHADRHGGVIDLHMLSPVAPINGARIRELTGDDTIPEIAQIVLRAFKAVVGSRTFYVGHCLGDRRSFSPIGIAVIERLSIEASNSVLHIVPVVRADIAWDIVMRHLRSFVGQILLFVFPNSSVYDAGTAEISYSRHIRQFDPSGAQCRRLSDEDRHRILEREAAMLSEPPPPSKFYPSRHVAQEDAPWIFRVGTPAGKVLRAAVWDGRRDYAHEFSEDIIRWVGGNKIAIVQVDSPVGINRRSPLDLTHWLSKDFDGVIHWARDTEVFQSILRSFIRLDLESVDPPELPEGWEPEVTLLGANGAPRG